MNNKETYKHLCETEGCAIPLFLQYWWMDTVCQGKQWDVLLAHDPQGNITAALPYLIGRKMGLKYIIQPQLTQYNGPWYSPSADRRDASRQLAAALREMGLTLFQQNFAPTVTDLDGWEGFSAQARRTYRIEDISDTQAVFNAFDKSRRQRQIRRCEKTLTPDENLTPEQFASFHTQYWQSRGQKDLLGQEFMIKVIATALERGQGILLGVRDGNGELHAARFVAFDNRCAYALLSALHPTHHANGASALLFWLIIQKLSTRTRSFDFEGSMDPGIAFSYSLYGAKPTTYYQLTRWCHPAVGKLLSRWI